MGRSFLNRDRIFITARVYPGRAFCLFSLISEGGAWGWGPTVYSRCDVKGVLLRSVLFYFFRYDVRVFMIPAPRQGEKSASSDTCLPTVLLCL